MYGHITSYLLFFPLASVAVCQSARAVFSCLTAVQASDHLQGLLLPEDLLGFKVRIWKSNVVSQIASVQMRLMMHLDTVIDPKKSSTFMPSDRFQSSLAGTPHPRSNFSSLHSKINDSFFSFPLESERTCSLCGIKKKTPLPFFSFSY